MNLRDQAWIRAPLALLIVAAGMSAAPLSAAHSASSSRSSVANGVSTSRILKVGPGERLAKPSDAAAIVRTGDTVTIAGGIYDDCAVWPSQAQFVTIEGTGSEGAGGAAIITGRSCEGKALFVIKGDNVTLRGLTFTGAHAPRHNGAGIRAEGGNLTIENSRFLANEEGILAAANPDARIIVRDSVFRGNGNCVEACAHGIYVGALAELRIERSRFLEQYSGHHIKSRASRTVLIGNAIEDGSVGTASYLVDLPNGGSLVMRGNTLEKGLLSENHTAAVILGEEGAINVTSEIMLEGNVFTNSGSARTTFVLNRTATSAVLRGNTLNGSVRPLDGPGKIER